MTDLYIYEKDCFSKEELSQKLKKEEKKCFPLIILNMREDQGMTGEGSINLVISLMAASKEEKPLTEESVSMIMKKN